MGKFLLTQQVYKSLGDVESATTFYEKYSQVNEFYQKVREMVNKNKQPRNVNLQGNVQKIGNEINYIEYSKDFEGIIQSFTERYDQFDWELY